MWRPPPSVPPSDCYPSHQGINSFRIFINFFLKNFSKFSTSRSFMRVYTGLVTAICYIRLQVHGHPYFPCSLTDLGEIRYRRSPTRRCEFASFWKSPQWAPYFLRGVNSFLRVFYISMNIRDRELHITLFGIWQVFIYNGAGEAPYCFRG